MAVNFDRPVTIPTADELEEVRETLSNATQAVADLRWRLDRIAEDVEREESEPAVLAERPTLAEIGALCVFRADALSYLEEAREYVERIGDVATRELDELRVAVGMTDA
jgi:hypothetical protein